MKTTLKFALLATLSTSALFAEKPVPVDCSKLSLSLKEEVSANQSLVLQIVDRAVRANSSCACEIVKVAIQATEADNKLIASIVEVAAVAAPEHLRIIAQCAVAVAPDSLEEVQAVMAKLDPGTGDGETASEKGVVDKQGLDKQGLAKEEEPPNPLDFPGGGLFRDEGDFGVTQVYLVSDNPATDLEP